MVLRDISTSVLNGFQAAVQFRSNLPLVRIIVVSSNSGQGLPSRARPALTRLSGPETPADIAVVKSDRLEALKSSTEFASGKWGSDRTGSVTEKRVTAGGRPGVSRLVKEPGSQSSFAGRNGKPQVHLHKHKSSGRRFRRRKPGRSDRDHFQRSDRLQRTGTVRIRGSRPLWRSN